MNAAKRVIIIAAAGGAALLLSGGGKKAKRKSVKKSEGGSDPRDSINKQFEEMVARWESKDGRAQMGRLYQIYYGDSLFEVAREALFGTRDPVLDAAKRAAVFEYAERIECSPWNQANYAVGPEELDERHAAWVRKRHVQRGISFMPRYSDNKARMMMGLKPSAAAGDSYAFIWLPMINIDMFERDGVITLQGSNWPDTERAMGHSKIDPPSEIVDIGFESVSSSEVGCPLPEGDFRKTIVA